MGMCRKVEMRKIWREGQRRSPRISALVAWKDKPGRRTPPKQSRCSKSRSSNTTARPVLAATVQRKEQQKEQYHPEGPASRTRARKKRKLRPLQDVATSPNAQEDYDSSDAEDSRHQSYEDHPVDTDEAGFCSKDSQKYEDRATSAVQQSSIPCTSRMPEKRILELVIDTLQRRDTHEIFAEPVDPEEVEDYYEIIKEPMDFGTMRAKLHEGMYNSLEEFEYDVFLITRNAMHFNSTSTVYFRQARAIDELAKKVFHVLKTDPDNFEMEFSGMRRRSGRRPQSEAKSSSCSSSHKLASNSRPGITAVNISPKLKPLSASGLSNLRLVQSNPRCSGTGSCYDAKDNDVLFGGGVSSSFEVDRRSTYKSWMSFLSENDSILSTMYDSPKLLVKLNQQESGYRKSLMSFVKDLGPVAQRIAERKLNEWQADPAKFLTPVYSSQHHLPSTAIQWLPPNLNGNDKVEMHMAGIQERAYVCNEMGICSTSVTAVPSIKDRNSVGEVRAETHSWNMMDASVVSQSSMFKQKQVIGSQLVSFSSTADAGKHSFPEATLGNKDYKSTSCKLEKIRIDNASWSSDSVFKEPHARPLGFRLTGNSNFPTSSWPLQANGMLSFDQTKNSMYNPNSRFLMDENQATPRQRPTHGLSDSSKTDWESSEPWTPGSSYVFNLPFLKTRLDQINCLRQGHFLQASGSGMQAPYLGRMGEICNENHPRSSLETRRSKLALQL
ncbi:hypothetical protein Tsubulata_000080 [Turnera subulata]|uniref:Bromo domain-containing protein n=1 Tax=Turnera subulata TaxID=218843 RepID=A0A9Q0FKP5_9ROSI|nr:hypothetical protein Tsubulata_000080 [Turnera subulata]